MNATEGSGSVFLRRAEDINARILSNTVDSGGVFEGL